MGKILAEIDNDLKSWIQKQKIFFVASAPLSSDGHLSVFYS